MPKRKHEADSEYLRWKIRKLEKKLEKTCKQREKRKESECSNSSVEVDAMLSDHEENIEIQTDTELSIVNEVQAGTSVCASGELTAAVPESDITTMECTVDPGPTQPELDEEILNLLGESPPKGKKYGLEIQNEIAVRWQHIATSGLAKDTKKELLEKYLVPKNCTKIDAPKLNPETKAALSDVLVKRDKAIENKQTQIASCISCISTALTHLFSCENKDQTVIKLLIDAGRLLCDSQYFESMQRRSFICSSLRRDVKVHLYNTEIDTFLFGENLSDTLKSAKAISKSGAEIKVPDPPRKNIQKPKQSTQPLNQRPPLPSTRQAGAARRYEPTTATRRSRQQQPPRPPPRSHPPPPAPARRR